jgi:hypothetical protein
LKRVHDDQKYHKISIRFFADRKVRAIWDEENNKWWFSVLDIATALTDQDDYTKNTKRLQMPQSQAKKENSELVSITNQLKCPYRRNQQS